MKRSRKLVNIRSAGSVAVLFELTGQDVYHDVHRFLQEIQEKKIKVKALGFSDSKHMSSQFLPVLSFDLFNRKDLNWMNIPRSTVIKDFIETEYDICINIAPETCFPLRYIAALSRARLKTGAYREHSLEDPASNLSQIYDILIKAEEPHDQGECLRNTHEYLTILNPGKHDGKI